MNLIEELASFSDDPVGFVYWAFPWNELGSELEGKTGPEEWQLKLLRDLRNGLVTIDEAIQIARTSGHGVGKSAAVAWIILWAISTFEDTRGIVTANTENQLKTKTWAELAKWFRMFIARDLFKMTATRLYSADPEHENTWRMDMIPWSEKNPEAFAGLHNQGKRILVVMDEASAIADVIWETVEGALTDTGTQIIWLVFGNPTRTKGRFRDCFFGGKFAHRWKSDRVDSRTVSFTDKKQIARWIADYGEDSDFVRVRVLGVFPRVDAESFISYALAYEASQRDVEPQIGFPVLLGVDVGRFGDDPSVIYPRQGRDAKSRAIEVYHGLSTMQLVAKIVQAFHKYNCSVAFVDEGGVGGGVVDRLGELMLPVIGVDFGSGPDGVNPNTGVKYANKRAEIWGGLRDWLPTGAIQERVPGLDKSVPDELAGPTYGLNSKEAIVLEAKKEMRARGEPSPNIADALATTFAYPAYEPAALGLPVAQARQCPDYDPYSRENLEAA